MSSSYSIQHLRETVEIIAKINPDDCEKCVAELRATRLALAHRAGTAPTQPDA